MNQSSLYKIMKPSQGVNMIIESIKFSGWSNLTGHYTELLWDQEKWPDEQRWGFTKECPKYIRTEVARIEFTTNPIKPLLLFPPPKRWPE